MSNRHFRLLYKIYKSERGFTMIKFNTAEECQKYMQDKKIGQFDIKFCDLLGKWHHITLMSDSLDAKILEKGVGFDSSSIPRFRDVRNGDMAACPDLSACFMDSTFDIPTLSTIANIVEANTAEPTNLDPRTVLRQAIDYLKNSGIGDSFVCAPELEFYLFDGLDSINDRYETGYQIDIADTLKLSPGTGYLAAGSDDYWRNARSEMALKIASMDLSVRYHHVEVGEAGQQEIEFGFMPALVAADGIMLGKFLIRSVASDLGVEACFMPKPIAHAAGNGMHIHFRLYKDNENLFAGDGYAGLSGLGKNFIGGILTHGRALLALLASGTNSYRRLKPGHETPTRFFFSSANREAAIRIPRYSTGKHVRAEFRPGDALMNPYLGIAALLMAGLDGVKNGLDPTPRNLGPFDGTPPSIDKSEHPECFLPSNLEESLDALEKDHQFLLEGNVFDDLLLNNFITYKRDTELDALLGAPHPKEYEMYYDL